MRWSGTGQADVRSSAARSWHATRLTCRAQNRHAIEQEPSPQSDGLVLQLPCANDSQLLQRLLLIRRTRGLQTRPFGGGEPSGLAQVGSTHQVCMLPRAGGKVW